MMRLYVTVGVCVRRGSAKWELVENFADWLKFAEMPEQEQKFVSKLILFEPSTQNLLQAWGNSCYLAVWIIFLAIFLILN